jgi:hypothetical protein
MDKKAKAEAKRARRSQAKQVGDASNSSEPLNIEQSDVESETPDESN